MGFERENYAAGDSRWRRPREREREREVLLTIKK
jgi:hypothetical protein